MIKDIDLNKLSIVSADETMIEKLAMIKGVEDISTVKSRIDKSVTGEVVYLVALIDEKPRGHVLLKFSGKPTAPNYPDMEDVFVVEYFRGKGIGTRLIKKCEEITKDKGFKQIGLAVNPTLNPRTKILYERLGYKVTNEKQYLDGVYNRVEDWVIDMVKDLI